MEKEDVTIRSCYLRQRESPIRTLTRIVQIQNFLSTITSKSFIYEALKHFAPYSANKTNFAYRISTVFIITVKINRSEGSEAKN